MRTISNGITVYQFEELSNNVKFKLFEKLYGKDVESISEDEFKKIREYYIGAEFYSDGTIYEEI